MAKGNKQDDLMGALSGLLGGMQDAYAEGLSAMGQAGAAAAEDMEPDHELWVQAALSGKPEGRPFNVSATVVFRLELGGVLDMEGGPASAISAMLEGLGVDLEGQEGAVVEQLSTPRIVGVVDRVEDVGIELHGPDGRLDAELNESGTALITVEDDALKVNFLGVFTFPRLPEAFAIVPGAEEMEANVRIPRDAQYEPLKFAYEDSSSGDTLKVAGTVQLKPLD
jgi:hypothetical protein